MEAAPEAPEKIEMTKEEYERLLAAASKQTVTVDAAEYAALVQIKPAYEKLKGEFDRGMQRLREVEGLLKREAKDHADELELMLKQVKKLSGQPGA